MHACVCVCPIHGDKTIVLPSVRGYDLAGCVRASRSLKQKGERVGDSGDDQPVLASLYVKRVAGRACIAVYAVVACGRRAGAPEYRPICPRT